MNKNNINMTKEKKNFVKAIAENESNDICLSFYVYGLIFSLIIKYYSYEKSVMNNILFLIFIVIPLVIFFNSYKNTNNIQKFIYYSLGILTLNIIDFYIYKNDIKQITISYILYGIVIIFPLVLFSQVRTYKINKSKKKKNKDKLKKYNPEYSKKLLELERREYEIKKDIEDFNNKNKKKMITIDNLNKRLEEIENLKKNLI